MITTAKTTSLKVGDFVKLAFPYSTGGIISFYAKCYRITEDGIAGIRIPAKVMAIRFVPYPSAKMLVKNQFAEFSIKRAA
jgi:molybdopterin/thiamine biosynthesis adenylyltransferase